MKTSFLIGLIGVAALSCGCAGRMMKVRVYSDSPAPFTAHYDFPGHGGQISGTAQGGSGAVVELPTQDGVVRVVKENAHDALKIEVFEGRDQVLNTESKSGESSLTATRRQSNWTVTRQP